MGCVVRASKPSASGALCTNVVQLSRGGGMDAGELVTILYCGANPIDKARNHIDLELESREIEAAISGSKLRLYSKYATRPSDLPKLLEEQKPTILHFGLHGVANGATGGEFHRDFDGVASSAAGLVLIEAGGVPVVLDAGSLHEMLQVCKGKTKCVVLNACHSVDVAREVGQQVEHVVGMNAAVSDAGAIAFSKVFYRSLAHNKPYREAYNDACKELRWLSKSEASVPVFFERPGKEHERPWRIPAQRRRFNIGWLGSVFLVVMLGLLTGVALATGHGPLVSKTRLSLMSLREPVASLRPSERLRIVLIDEQSELALKSVREGGTEIGTLGTSWRVLYARAIDRLTDAGAAVIVFDIAFQNEPITDLEKLGTAALASSISRAFERGTKIVLTAMERSPESGQPLLSTSLLAALKHSDARCAIAHPCIAEPAGGPSVPLLPLVLEDETRQLPPSFALSLCAYALAEGTLPSWSGDDEKVFLALDRARSVSFTGLEYYPNVVRCEMASPGAVSVHRVLAPFPSDLSRYSLRVLPFEALVSSAVAPKRRELDVAKKIVLIGQRDVVPDIVLDDAAPDERPLWGVSAHAAAIDALLQQDGLMLFIPPFLQMAWIGGVCLFAIVLRVGFDRRSRWFHAGSLVFLAAADVAISAYVARYYGLVTDPGNHIIALVIAYFIAGHLQIKSRSSFT